MFNPFKKKDYVTREEFQELAQEIDSHLTNLYNSTPKPTPQPKKRGPYKKRAVKTTKGVK